MRHLKIIFLLLLLNPLLALTQQHASKHDAQQLISTAVKQVIGHGQRDTDEEKISAQAFSPEFDSFEFTIKGCDGFFSTDIISGIRWGKLKECSIAEEKNKKIKSLKLYFSNKLEKVNSTNYTSEQLSYIHYVWLYVPADKADVVKSACLRLAETAAK